ncbi:hypothetical protein V1524DRAFT_472781 [Lipomyces starkeyi]
MSTASTSASIPIQDGASYPSIKVLILRSEDDATRADKVAITISGCMPDDLQLKRLPNFLSGSFFVDNIDTFLSRIPALILQPMMTNVKRFVHARSLLIIPYLGHAIVDMESNRLQLISENDNRKMLWTMIHGLLLASTDDSVKNPDLLALLDCCYAGSATSVQLLAALMTIVQFERACMASISHNDGNLYVNVESLFGKLYRSKIPTAPDAIYKIIGNRAIWFRPHRSSSTQDIYEVLQLTKRIPPEFKVTIENAYESKDPIFPFNSASDLLI